ncbi:MAG: hypothetical protein HY360_13940 [Verrucomicrobia bacterium]|nr:hypothetical protein [Verrucomicrobiota bacterium]
MTSMVQLTRQEQITVALIMLALIVGAIVRLYRHATETGVAAHPSPIAIHHD